MRHFTITIEGQVADDVTDDMLEDMASRAFVQVEEPLVTDPDDDMRDIEFDMNNAKYSVVIEAVDV